MNALAISKLIEAELVAYGDVEIIDFIRQNLVGPRQITLEWDYGPDPDAPVTYVGWVVLEDLVAGARVVYCEHGFGPSCPWGLVSLDSDIPNMGMDSGWFTSFLNAFFDSFSSSRLPIYQVIATHPDGTKTILSEESGLYETWVAVQALRETGDDLRYDCETMRFPVS
jgi:hypothetical protein